jgi:hypothetical protein
MWKVNGRWTTDAKNYSPLKPLSQMNWNLVGSIYGKSSINYAHFVSIHWQTWPPQAIIVSDWLIFKNLRFFRNQPIRNKNGLWWPCLLTDRDKISNRYRGPSIDASYQVSVHLAKQFLRRRFLKISQSETVLYKDCSFHPDSLTNLAATGNSCFWLVDF